MCLSNAIDKVIQNLNYLISLIWWKKIIFECFLNTSIMNSKIYISSIIIASLAFISCKKELEVQENTSTSELVRLGLAKDTSKTAAPVAPAPATTTAAAPQSGTIEKSFTVTPPANNAVPALLSTETSTTKPAATAEGTNPVHGQPGHRCDIAVGAPLPKS
jgi:hypothetical protein